MELLVRNTLKKGTKTICVVRYGAWGDAIIITPIFSKLKQQGYYITLNCTEKCFEILHNNPYIDAFIYQKTNEIPPEKLDEHWDKLKTQFTRFINLSESIEGTLLKVPSQKEYNWPHEERHKICNKNYYDFLMERAGLEKYTGELPEIYFKSSEERWVKKFLKKYKKKFIIVWCLSGSSPHKIYPYAGNCIDAVARGLKDSITILVGEPAAKGIVNKHRRIIDKCGDLSIRQSCILTKYVDLIVSPETSVLAASAAFSTPKVALLSHSSVENLTKYYINCESVFQDVSCYPCHKLHYTKTSCPLDKELEMPICMSLLHPKKVLEPIEKIYNKWRKNNECSDSTDRDDDYPESI